MRSWVDRAAQRVGHRFGDRDFDEFTLHRRAAAGEIDDPVVLRTPLHHSGILLGGSGNEQPLRLADHRPTDRVALFSHQRLQCGQPLPFHFGGFKPGVKPADHAIK